MSPKILFIFLLLLSSINCIDITGILAKLKSYLQNNVDNDKFIVFMDSLKTILYRDFPDHLSKNKEAFKNHLATIKENKMSYAIHVTHFSLSLYFLFPFYFIPITALAPSFSGSSSSSFAATSLPISILSMQFT